MSERILPTSEPIPRHLSNPVHLTVISRQPPRGNRKEDHCKATDGNRGTPLTTMPRRTDTPTRGWLLAATGQQRPRAAAAA